MRAAWEKSIFGRCFRLGVVCLFVFLFVVFLGLDVEDGFDAEAGGGVKDGNERQKEGRETPM